MKELFYDVAYAGGLLLGSPWFLYKMAVTGKYRSGLLARLGFIPERAGEAPCIWIHGVSVGEILAAKPLVEALQAAYPGTEIALSSTTNTGMAVARKSYPGNSVFYFPLDFSRAVARAMRRIRPAMIILMELEVWPNFLGRASSLGVPVVVVNGRISERAWRAYRRFRPLVGGAFAKVERYLVQTGEYKDRLVDLGVDKARIDVSGNIKFDAISTDVDKERALRLRGEMGILPEEKLVIGGSTHAGEEAALLDACAELKRRHTGLRLLIVPRHKERFEEAAAAVAAAGLPLFRRSRLSAGDRPSGGEVILGDTMGELQALYEAADVAFVGGSLIPHGGQNMFEPAAKGKPVVFGPHVENFPEADDLLVKTGAAIRLSDSGQLAAALEKYLDPAAALEAGMKGAAAVRAAKGAAARAVDRVREIYENKLTGT